MDDWSTSLFLIKKDSCIVTGGVRQRVRKCDRHTVSHLPTHCTTCSVGIHSIVILDRRFITYYFSFHPSAMLTFGSGSFALCPRLFHQQSMYTGTYLQLIHSPKFRLKLRRDR